MDSLEEYANIFDKEYPAYADARYGEIAALMKIYDTTNVVARAQSKEFARFLKLIVPVIAIKNYKSRIPFPEDLVSVVLCMASIRSVTSSGSNKLNCHKPTFEKLLSLQGFQLPTVSAIFHFSRPKHFPIVDVNVEAACRLLKERYPTDFAELDAPSLPADNTSAANKAKKYGGFIKFIAKVRKLQGKHGGKADFRYIDKALMVLGVTRLRDKVEALRLSNSLNNG
jgi:hypothetical protein